MCHIRLSVNRPENRHRRGPLIGKASELYQAASMPRHHPGTVCCHILYLLELHPGNACYTTAHCLTPITIPEAFGIRRLRCPNNYAGSTEELVRFSLGTYHLSFWTRVERRSTRYEVTMELFAGACSSLATACWAERQHGGQERRVLPWRVPGHSRRRTQRPERSR